MTSGTPYSGRAATNGGGLSLATALHVGSFEKKTTLGSRQNERGGCLNDCNFWGGGSIEKGVRGGGIALRKAASKSLQHLLPKISSGFGGVQDVGGVGPEVRLGGVQTLGPTWAFGYKPALLHSVILAGHVVDLAMCLFGGPLEGLRMWAICGRSPAQPSGSGPGRYCLEAQVWEKAGPSQCKGPSPVCARGPGVPGLGLYRGIVALRGAHDPSPVGVKAWLDVGRDDGLTSIWWRSQPRVDSGLEGAARVVGCATAEWHNTLGRATLLGWSALCPGALESDMEPAEDRLGAGPELEASNTAAPCLEHFNHCSEAGGDT